MEINEQKFENNDKDYAMKNVNITEISKIIALLFHLCSLYHYYFYSGVGHRALLQREHVISLLYHYSARLFSIIL